MMYPLLGSADTYQLGDLNGLWRLRTGLGCVITGARASDGPTTRAHATP